jgi:hypothetical protein
MKKLQTLTLSVVVLAAFTGLSAAQEKKLMTPAAIPPADTLTLSATKNVASKTGCPVTARLSFKNNPAFTYPGSTVTFNIDNGPPQTPPSCVTNAKSECPSTVKNGQTVHATDSKFLLTSNKFTCSGKFPME